MAGTPVQSEAAMRNNFVLPVRHRETRHQKSSSSGSIPPGPFPAIDEAMDIQATSDYPHRMFAASKCPQGLDLSSAAWRVYRDRSPTSSTMSSSIMPDSATTCSMPMSPTSSTFTRATTPDIEGPELFLNGPEGAQPAIEASKKGPNRSSLTSLFGFLSHRDGNNDNQNDHRSAPEDDDDAVPTTPPATRLHMPRPINTPRPSVEDYEEAADPPPLKQKFSFETGSDRLSRNSSVTTASEAPHTMSVHREEADSLLNYTLQSTYGVELEEIGGPPALLRHLAARFIQDVGRIAFAGPPVVTQLTHTTSNSSGGSGGPLSRTTSSNRGSVNGKRKKAPGSGGRDDDDADDLTDDDNDAGAPFKKARQTPRDADENLRLSCPFRKRNPARFNVRSHHSCAMTYFPKFAELRQHIVKQHKRADPTAFLCDRCNRDFPSRRDLRDHQRLPRELMCDIADHDPECGIDGPTATKLLSRKRASGTTADVQWKEIWHLVFPDDDDHEVKDWDFCPVIEHFEITNRFMEGLKCLEGSLRNKGLNESVLETIGNLYRNKLIHVLEQCVEEARTRPYSNRSNRKGEGVTNSYLAATRPGLLFGRGAQRPDSGIDLGDEGSSEGDFSVGLLSTSGFGQDESVYGSNTLKRSSSAATEVRVSTSGAGGRVLTPLVEQRPEMPLGGVMPEEHQGHVMGGQDDGMGVGMLGQDDWVPDAAYPSMPGFWSETHGAAISTPTLLPGQEMIALPSGLTYPGWTTDGHMYQGHTWTS